MCSGLPFRRVSCLASRSWFNSQQWERRGVGAEEILLAWQQDQLCLLCSGRCLELIIFLRELLRAPWSFPANPSLGIAFLQTDVSLFQKSAEALSTALRDTALHPQLRGLLLRGTQVHLTLSVLQGPPPPDSVSSVLLSWATLSLPAL